MTFFMDHVIFVKELMFATISIEFIIFASSIHYVGHKN